jgi:hypothetical protein
MTSLLNIVGFRNQNEINIEPEQTDGVLVVGDIYKITNYVGADDFTNVAEVISGTINENNCIFRCIDTTPDEWSGESELTNISLTYSTRGVYVNDLAGITLENVQKSQYLKSDLQTEQTMFEYLKQIRSTEIDNLVKNFIETAQNLLKNQKVNQYYNVASGLAKEKIEQSGYFCGFLFAMQNALNLKSTIENFSLQIAQPDAVTLYLYDLSQNEPIKTFEASILKGYSKIAIELEDFIMEYQDDNGSDKIYAFGYYQYNSEAPLFQQLSESNEIYKIEFEQFRNPYTDVTPIYVEKDYHNYNSVSELYDLFNVSKIVLANYSFGLDCRISQEANYNDIIETYANRFAEAIQLTIAKKIIEDCLYTNEFNTITESNRETWQNQLFYINNMLNGYEFEDKKGNSGRKKGVITELVERFEGIDNVCFPKRAKIVI